MKHSNIALFVVHEGCPNRCSFCNQNIIANQQKKLKVEDIKNAVNTAVSSGNTGAQLAFFGGSFTAIDRDYMISLLKAAKEQIDLKKISSIRISTRPDYIDEEILSILKKYGVKSIELGAQSMDDEVLYANERGHTSLDVENASKMIKEKGFELGLQMMTGLYKDTDEKSIETAKRIIELKPDTVRIYPTVVLEHTRLSKLYESGEYRPHDLDEEINLCSKLLLMFSDNDIPVIRLGLHSGGGQMDGYVAGVYHPAFRELCESKIYLDRIIEIISGYPKGKYTLVCDKGEISKVIGNKKTNIKKLAEIGYECHIKEAEKEEKTDVFKVTRNAGIQILPG